MGSELLDYHKEDNTMFFLLVFFVLHTAVTSGENCPEQKRVGDTCYTRVAMTDTHQYGCKENCTYKKTNSSDTQLYCFKTGSLQVTENGCQRLNSYLAPVETQAQQDFIVKVIDSTTSDRTFIGGTSINNTDLIFYWLLTSTAVDDSFTFWGPGEPNHKDA